MLWLLSDFDFLSVLLRAADLSLEAFALGGLIFLLAAAVPARAAAGQLAIVRRATARFALALALTQAAAASLSVSVLTIQSGFPLRSLVSAGFFLVALAVVFGAVLLAMLMRSSSRRAVWAGLGPATLILAGSVGQSHASSRLDHRALLTVLTALHHLGTAGWVGAMLFLLLTLRLSHSQGNAQALARGYSRLALVSAPALALAGLGMGWFFIGSWAGLYGTAYGLMVTAKTALMLGMLLLGAGNYRLLRDPLPVSGGSAAAVLPHAAVRPAARPKPFLLRLRAFAEAEIALGMTALLAAASLTSQPPAVDLVKDRLTARQITARLRPEPPRLTSPALAQLGKPIDLKKALADVEFGRQTGPSAADKAWSEYNHNWAGLVVLAAALMAFAARALPPGPARRFAGNWPLLFIGLAAFILLRADPEAWPLGPQSFWASFASPDVLQHRFYAVLITAFAFFEWAVATGRWRGSRRAAYVFPLLCSAGGAALLTHTHGLANVREETLAEFSHGSIALFGAFAGCGRWLQLRLPGPRAARWAGLVWPLALALAGLVRLNDRES